jgi:hypothetical protein
MKGEGMSLESFVRIETAEALSRLAKVYSVEQAFHLGIQFDQKYFRKHKLELYDGLLHSKTGTYESKRMKAFHRYVNMIVYRGKKE